MKKTVIVFFLFAVSWRVRSFNDEEILNLVCSIPKNYMLRFIGCVLNESPPSIVKFTNVMYQCVDEYYENNGKSDSIRLLICNNYVHEDEDVKNCLNEKSKKLIPPDDSEITEFRMRIDDCMFSAK